MISAKLAFYKGKGNYIDYIIRIWTKSEYSHVELIANGKWYSTSPRLGKLVARNVYPDSSKWDIIDVEIDESLLNDLYKQYSGCEYDWKGIVLSQFIQADIEDKSKLFCSEWCAMVLGLEKSNRYSPGGLYRKVANNVR